MSATAAGTVTRLAGTEVTCGPVPDRLADPTYVGPLDAAAPDRYLLRLPGVGRFLVQGAAEGDVGADGVRITVERSPTATDADVACLLAGPVRQVGWLLRGRFALRGCGVVIAGHAVAIVGPSAAGKSTLSAALAQRGHGLLADGALPVRFDGVPVAEAADDAVQVWPDAARRLGLDEYGGELIRPGLAKRRYRFGAADAAPLTAVIVLDGPAGTGTGAVAGTRTGAVAVAGIRTDSPEPLRGWDAAQMMVRYTAMQPVIRPFGAEVPHFHWCTQLAMAVRVVRLPGDWPGDWPHADLPALAEGVEALARSGP